ncbi:MAG: ArgR family transcriptional regulator [bacterium]|nr:ArgR family transcriptional regulator [bacterium]
MARDSVLESHILNIIQTHAIADQHYLQISLKERGYDVPQATLSRRLKKMNIAKVSGQYRVIDFDQPNLPVVLNMQVSDFGLIVLHTHPGHANSLAYFFDQNHVTYSEKDSKNSGILGTIAGDDTVLLILKGKDALENVRSLMREKFPYLRG